MDREDLVIDSLKFAGAWAVVTMGVFGTLVLTMFADWSTSDKVALFQAFVVIAGFGAALIVLAVTVSQYARR